MLIFAASFTKDIYCMPNIKNKIKECGFTTQQIAERLGISQQAVSQAINGNPTLSRLEEIAGAIGIPVSELVSDKPRFDEPILTIPKGVKEIRIKVE
jgi:transcriptional regulator with XRE-family HTH domain